MDPPRQMKYRGESRKMIRRSTKRRTLGGESIETTPQRQRRRTARTAAKWARRQAKPCSCAACRG